MNQMVLAQQPASVNGHDQYSFHIPHIKIHLFVSTPLMLATARDAIVDRRLSRASTKVHESDAEEVITFYTHEDSPDLIVVEAVGDEEKIVSTLVRLAEVCSETTRVLVVGYINDVAFYRRMIQMGVSDYALGPVTSMELIGFIGSIFRRQMEDEKLGRSIACLGASGGAGSSTVAHNLAAAIAREIKSHVILLDLDFSFGCSDLVFGLEDKKNLSEVLQSPERLDAALIDRMLVEANDHLSILSATGVLHQTIDIDEGTAAHLLNVTQSLAHIVVVDLPHVWAPWSRKILRDVDEVVITSLPNLPGLRNLRNLCDEIRLLRPNDAAPRIVLNQVGAPKRRDVSAKTFTETIGAKLDAVIGYDGALFSRCENEGRIVLDEAPRSAAAKVFRGLATNYAPRAQRKQGGWGHFFRFRR